MTVDPAGSGAVNTQDPFNLPKGVPTAFTVSGGSGTAYAVGGAFTGISGDQDLYTVDITSPPHTNPNRATLVGEIGSPYRGSGIILGIAVASSSVPEPGLLAMLGVGLGGLAFEAWRGRRARVNRPPDPGSPV